MKICRKHNNFVAIFSLSLVTGAFTSDLYIQPMTGNPQLYMSQKVPLTNNILINIVVRVGMVKA